MCGDSAGGHLAIAVTILAILRQFRIPDGLVLHYPAASGNTGHFFPSTLLTLDDFLLNYNLLFYVATAFTRKGGDATSNFFISPIYTPPEILSRFPKTKILVAEVDPLRDQGVYFGLQLKRAGVDTEVFYFRDYVHNFLQFDDSTFGIPEFQNASKITLDLFKELLHI